VSFTFQHRASDSPLVETIWRTDHVGVSSFTSVAAANSEIVVTKLNGRTTFTVRGPETRFSPATVDADFEAFGIILKLGTYMPHLPASRLMNRNDVTLPEATKQSFWLLGSAWQFPDFENVDTFISRLVREGLLAYDPLISQVMQNRPLDLSVRTVRRRFLNATGLTQGEIHQIERARLAASLLMSGKPILDVVEEAGYFDQPHMTRSLKRFIGETPSQIPAVSMSLLYNTQPPE